MIAADKLKTRHQKIFAREQLLLDSLALMTDDDSNSCAYLIFPVIASKENARQEAKNNAQKDSDVKFWKRQRCSLNMSTSFERTTEILSRRSRMSEDRTKSFDLRKTTRNLRHSNFDNKNFELFRQFILDTPNLFIFLVASVLS